MLDARERERRDGARGRSPSRARTSSARRDARRERADRARDLLRVAAPVARDERDDGVVVADEDERLHDLVELAADCGGGVGGGRRAVRELLDPRLGPASRRKEDTRSTGSGQVVTTRSNLPAVAHSASAERDEARVVEARLARRARREPAARPSRSRTP